MSITLEIRGLTTELWPLSGSCLERIEKLRSTSARSAIELMFGDEAAQAGTTRKISREGLLQAIKEIAREETSLPGGFQLLIPPLADGMAGTRGRGFAGLLIGGIDHAVLCSEDHWTLQSMDDLRAGKKASPRYDSTDIQSDHRGVFRVIRRKSRRSDFGKILREIQTFLEKDESREVEVTWG